MKVTSYSHAVLQIDAAGFLSIQNSWDVASDTAGTGVEALLAEARLWAGAVGDPFRLPSDDGAEFTWSDSLFVTALAFQPVRRGLCRAQQHPDPPHGSLHGSLIPDLPHSRDALRGCHLYR